MALRIRGHSKVKPSPEVTGTKIPSLQERKKSEKGQSEPPLLTVPYGRLQQGTKTTGLLTYMNCRFQNAASQKEGQKELSSSA